VDSTSDDQLVAQAAGGSTRAMEELYARYRTRVMGYAFRVTGDRALAEDVLQRTFLYLFQHLDRYEPRGKFGAYLFRIARSYATDESVLARRAREPVAPRLGENLYTVPIEGDAEDSARKEEGVRAAVQELSAPLREVVELRLYQGLDYEQVAEVAGVSEATARSRMRYALESLRSSLGVARKPDSKK
jgi:RNA polymerase sigma-70 factor (ECF subfamily)